MIPTALITPTESTESVDSRSHRSHRSHRSYRDSLILSHMKLAKKLSWRWVRTPEQREEAYSAACLYLTQAAEKYCSAPALIEQYQEFGTYAWTFMRRRAIDDLRSLKKSRNEFRPPDEMLSLDISDLLNLIEPRDPLMTPERVERLGEVALLQKRATEHATQAVGRYVLLAVEKALSGARCSEIAEETGRSEGSVVQRNMKGIHALRMAAGVRMAAGAGAGG